MVEMSFQIKLGLPEFTAKFTLLVQVDKYFFVLLH